MIENINFYLAPSFLKKRNKIRLFIKSKIIEQKKHILLLNIFFCSKKEHLKINQKFLHHNYSTDIITFSANIKNNVGGDIYINIDQVKENAQIYKCSMQEEMVRVIFHGVLHLLGQEDKTDKDFKKMKVKENKWLKEFEEYVL